MKKIAVTVLAATILLVFLRISGFISWNTAKGLVLLCGALLSLYRDLRPLRRSRRFPENWCTVPIRNSIQSHWSMI